MNDSSGKVLIFGIDGATFEVMNPLLEEGLLPNLESLIAEGVRGPLRSTFPPISASAWVTFLTGKNPGKHGVFGFQNLNLSRYSSFDETLVNSSFFRGRTLLDYAGSRGKRILSYRVPLTYPPWPINGILVSGPPTPDRKKVYCEPADFARRFEAFTTLSHDELERAQKANRIEAIEDGSRLELEVMYEATREAIARGDDLVIAFTGIIDALHHRFWRFHDPGHPLYDPRAPELNRTAIRRWYEHVDTLVGRVLADLSPEWTVFVVSDHGGGPAPLKLFNVNCWLKRLGLLAENRQETVRVTGIGQRGVEWARYHVPAKSLIKRLLPQWAKRTVRNLRQGTHRVKWSETKAYALGLYYPVSAINLNLRGRQPQGVLEPGAEAEGVKRRIVAELREAMDPATGARLVDEVYTKEELYSGEYLPNIPDIVFVHRPGYYIGYGMEGIVGEVPESELKQISGSHTLDGVFIARGPSVRRGVELEGAWLGDILPTALYLTGAPIPADLDGRVLTDAVYPEFLRAHALCVEELAPEAESSAAQQLADEEEKEMRKFLKGLGYIGE